MTSKNNKEQIKIIGRNISNLLHEYDMTQVELANRLGVSESTVGKWTLGISAPRAGTMKLIADVFRVPVSAIVESQVKAKSYQQAYLFDRIANASEEDLHKLAQLLDIIEREKGNS